MGIFLGIQNNLKIRGSAAYPCCLVLRIKYNQTCFAAAGFLGGLIFGPGVFLGFVGSPGDLFWVMFSAPILSSP